MTPADLRTLRAENERLRHRVAKLEQALTMDRKTIERRTASRDAERARAGRLEAALQHQAHRNHEYVPTVCAGCAEAQRALEETE